MFIFLLILFFLFVGASLIGINAERAPLPDKPLLCLYPKVIKTILLFIYPSIALFIILLFMNWISTLTIIVPCLLIPFTRNIIIRISSYLIIAPLHILLYKKHNHNDEQKEYDSNSDDKEQIVYTCPDCKAEVTSDAKECPACGLKFDD